MNIERFNKEKDRLVETGMTLEDAINTAVQKEVRALETPRSYGVATNSPIVIMEADGEGEGIAWKAGEKFRAAGCDLGPDTEPIMIDGAWRVLPIKAMRLDPTGPKASVRIN